MCWGDDDTPEVTYEGPTESDKASLDIARQQRELYDSRFAPLERQYLEDINENLGGYAASTAVADTAQQVSAAKQKAGPGLASRGQFTGQETGYAGAHGAGVSAGVAEADTLGEQAKIDRNMRALQTGLGLASNISSTGQGMATQSTQSAITAANQAMDQQLSDYQNNTQLMSDLAGLAAMGAGNFAKTGTVLGMGKDVNTKGWGGSSEGSIMDKFGQKI